MKNYNGDGSRDARSTVHQHLVAVEACPVEHDVSSHTRVDEPVLVLVVIEDYRLGEFESLAPVDIDIALIDDGQDVRHTKFLQHCDLRRSVYSTDKDVVSDAVYALNQLNV